MQHLLAQEDAVRLPLADASVDAVVSSPPYCEARTYPENGRLWRCDALVALLALSIGWSVELVDVAGVIRAYLGERRLFA